MSHTGSGSSTEKGRSQIREGSLEIRMTHSISTEKEGGETEEYKRHHLPTKSHHSLSEFQSQKVCKNKKKQNLKTVCKNLIF